jgi:hypothetical protein
MQPELNGLLVEQTTRSEGGRWSRRRQSGCGRVRDSVGE